MRKGSPLRTGSPFWHSDARPGQIDSARNKEAANAASRLRLLQETAPAQGEHRGPSPCSAQSRQLKAASIPGPNLVAAAGRILARPILPT
jgi:hypothetical protein